MKDYVKLGQTNCMCPYYMMKSQISNCDVAVIPYNYVIDKDLRKQTHLPFKDAIIVFDEGHNIN